jgi:hypothetical protein
MKMVADPFEIKALDLYIVLLDLESRVSLLRKVIGRIDKNALLLAPANPANSCAQAQDSGPIPDFSCLVKDAEDWIDPKRK